MKLAEVMEPKGPVKKAKSHGDLRPIRIELAENGFTITCDYEPKKASKGNEPMPHEPPENYVFESAESAADYVREMLRD